MSPVNPVNEDERYRYVEVARVGDVAEGKGKQVRVDAREIALYLLDGTYYALKNFCPHEGDPLWRGRIEDAAVVCPNHGWKFELATGKCVRHGDRDLRTFPVKVEGDRILIGV